MVKLLFVVGITLICGCGFNNDRTTELRNWQAKRIATHSVEITFANGSSVTYPRNYGFYKENDYVYLVPSGDKVRACDVNSITIIGE